VKSHTKGKSKLLLTFGIKIDEKISSATISNPASKEDKVFTYDYTFDEK
jgi:hypothetical protein